MGWEFGDLRMGLVRVVRMERQLTGFGNGTLGVQLAEAGRRSCRSLMFGHWLSRSGNQAWRRDYVYLSFQKLAGRCLRSEAWTQGGTGPEPTARRDAPGGAELPAPTHTARALPPGVPALARPGGRLVPVAEHPALETPRPVARHSHLPAPCWRPRALHPGPLLRAQAHRTQPPPEPSWPRWGAQERGLTPGRRWEGPDAWGAWTPWTGWKWIPREEREFPQGKPPGETYPWVGGLARNLGTNCFHLTGGFQKWTVLSREDNWAEEKENLEVMPGAYMQTSFLSSYRWTSFFPKGQGGCWVLARFSLTFPPLS